MSDVSARSGELTAGERAYLESGGSDATALMAENPPAAPGGDTPAAAAAPAAAPAPGATAAPAAAAAAAPEAPELGEEEIPTHDGKGKRRMVDSRALKEERTLRRAAEEEAKKERDLRARVDERLKLLSEAIAQPDPATAPAAAAAPVGPPEVEADVFGAVKYVIDELTGLKKSMTAREQTAEEERVRNEAIATARFDRRAFEQKQPDFTAAYHHLLNTRGRQLEIQGYNKDEIKQWLYTEELDMIMKALKAGKSPAERLYELSKTMGYVPAAPAAAAAPANGAAAAPAAAAAAAAAPAPANGAAKPPAGGLGTVTEEIERIAAGQRASRSLSNGGGGPGEELSLETIANMPDKEFERLMADPAKREAVERAMGKRN